MSYLYRCVDDNLTKPESRLNEAIISFLSDYLLFVLL